MTTEHLSNGQDHLARRTRYRRLYFGVLAAGVLGYLVLIGVWNSVQSDAVAVAAVGVYWLAFVVALGIHIWVQSNWKTSASERSARRQRCCR